MRSTAIIIGILGITIAPFYQFFLKDVLFVSLGIGRVLQPIEDFKYRCRKIHDPSGLLESCEDLWLDDEGRVLYAACVDLKSRHEWSPGGDRLNSLGRTLNGRFVALNVDAPGAEDNYGAHRLEITGDYQGPAGTKAIDPNGFDVEILPNGHLRFWMANLRPPVDALSGEHLDGTKFGANGTVEIFELRRGESTLEFQATFAARSDAVSSPNNVAATGNGGCIVSNDHSYPIGLRRSLDPLIGGGSLAYCSKGGICKHATTNGLSFPNGLVRGLDGLFYVPSSITGRISVWALQDDQTLLKIDEVNIGYPMDNLSVDADGTIFAAAFPDSLKLIKEMKNPVGGAVPSTVFKVRRLGDGKWEVAKILEDKLGLTLPTVTTTAVHDAKTGRLFLGGVISSYMTVCEPL